MATESDLEAVKRGAFSSRKVFILAAIGSAVGLGNIWRFPYVAYENGGGAFMIPYLVALLTAGLPFLLMDYGLGHKFRGSAPLSFARLHRRTEFLGWWQVGICFLIAIYYAAVLAWALRYTFFSVNKAWEDNPEGPAGFFLGEFLQVGPFEISTDVVAGVLVPLLVVWAVVLLVMALGVQRGIGNLSLIFIPVLVITFLVLVVQALTLDGAAGGLDAFFTPNWDALTEGSVWVAAFGQMFFSLSIGFGIMITYASYVHRRTDMTGSGLVVGFSNTGFELLAGIGVFAALGFMAQAQNVPVGEAAAGGGVGLAFIAFPTIISEAPAGALLGVLFFGSLVIAGLTSLVSVVEVVISAVRDKFEMTRVGASMAVGVPAAVLSLALFATTSGLWTLDTTDHFINHYGILVVAVVSMLVVAWGVRALRTLADHHDVFGSLKLNRTWITLISVITPAAITWVVVDSFINEIDEPYEGYPQWLLNTFGWGSAAVVLVFGILASLVKWRPETSLAAPPDVSEELPR
jgi:neurotransmitter:Na+ symporter, NSS family